MAVPVHVPGAPVEIALMCRFVPEKQACVVERFGRSGACPWRRGVACPESSRRKVFAACPEPTNLVCIAEEFAIVRILVVRSIDE